MLIVNMCFFFFLTFLQSVSLLSLDHHRASLYSRYVELHQQLLSLYRDKDGAREAELQALSGGSGGGSSDGIGGGGVWSSFYRALGELRIYHSTLSVAAKQAVAAAENGSGVGGGVGAGLNGANGSANDDLSSAEFSEALDELDLLMRGPGGVANLANANGGAATAGGAQNQVLFSAEENFGNRCDLNLLYEKYINLPAFFPQCKSTDYISYLRKLSQLSSTPASNEFLSIPRITKLRGQQKEEYKKYLLSLRDYFLSLHARIHPLVSVDILRQMIEEDFAQRWREQKVGGWFGKGEEGESGAAGAAAGAELNGSGNKSSSASSSSPSSSNPLFCAACNKLFAKDTVFNAHLTGKKHLKNEELRKAMENLQTSAESSISTSSSSSSSPADAPSSTADSSSSSSSSSSAAPTSLATKYAQEAYHLALIEEEILQLTSLLATPLENTVDYLRKKQTRTYEEIRQEKEEQVEKIRKAMEGGGGKKEGEKKKDKDSANDDTDDPSSSDKIYNPLNIPLGPDGRPIPYWLYKLQGLNQKFTCEICGGYTYAGPRNYEQHFFESRHSYGMRSLGIPNTRHFMFVAEIAQAKGLWERLKKEGGKNEWRGEEEEECEDEEGNVYKKKDFEQLKKQGLV